MGENTVTAYVIYEDGTTERQRYIGQPDVEPVLSKPGRYVTEAEYNAALGEINEANAQGLDQLIAAEVATLKGDFDALVQLGLPEAAARRMSGYTGS